MSQLVPETLLNTSTATDSQVNPSEESDNNFSLEGSKYSIETTSSSASSSSSSIDSILNSEESSDHAWELEEHPTLRHRFQMQEFLNHPECKAHISDSDRRLDRMQRWTKEFTRYLDKELLQHVLLPRSMYKRVVQPPQPLKLTRTHSESEEPPSESATVSSSSSSADSSSVQFNSNSPSIILSDESQIEFVPSESVVRFVVVSDTHCQHRELKLPAGEVLLHCGDFGGVFDEIPIAELTEQMMSVSRWLNRQPFRRVFVIPGNHDVALDSERYPQYQSVLDQFRQSLAPHVTYLCHSGATYRGLRIWGTPHMEDRTQTIMVGCTYFSNAFERSLASLRAVMSEIPEQLDVLMTHTPPFPHMAKRLAEMEQPPHVHCFGHDHREAKIAFHSIGKPLVLDAGLRLRRRFYVNAAQEKMLSQEWLCGGAAWVFDLQARESDQPF